MDVLRRTQSEKMFPCMFIGDLQLEPLAGSPHELQSGPIIAMESGSICMQIHRTSLGTELRHSHIVYKYLFYSSNPCILVHNNNDMHVCVSMIHAYIIVLRNNYPAGAKKSRVLGLIPTSNAAHRYPLWVLGYWAGRNSTSHGLQVHFKI